MHPTFKIIKTLGKLTAGGFIASGRSGQLARMSGSACKVYYVIKSYTNYKTGFAEPAIVTIAIKSGLSLAQVKRGLTSLGKSGLIRKRRAGRHNVYQIVEHIPLTDLQGTTTAMAQWEYVPAKVSAVTEELKRCVEVQSIDDFVLIRIDKLHVQVTEQGSQSMQIGDIDLGSMSTDLRKSLERLLTSVAKRATIPDDTGTSS